jgi:hypothetical protein
MRKFLLGFTVMILLISFAIIAADAPALVAAPAAATSAAGPAAGSTVIPEWMQYALTGLGTVIAGAILWFFRHLKAKGDLNDAKIQAIDAIEVGIHKAEEEMVAKLKAASDDGTLTAEEKKQVRDFAIQQAKMLATESGKAILNAYGKDFLNMIVEKILAKKKATAAAATPPSA